MSGASKVHKKDKKALTMQVISVSGCLGIEQEKQTNNIASDADVTANILKSVEIQSMLRPLATNEIDQCERLVQISM